MLNSLLFGFVLNELFIMFFMMYARYDTMMKETWVIRLALEKELVKIIEEIEQKTA